MRTLRNLAMALLLGVSLAAAPSAEPAAGFICEVESYSCWGNWVSFKNCTEDCGFNWNWCVDYCGGTVADFGCGGVPPSTSGFCHCTDLCIQ